jgi:MoaA/NifB/PqqE/SkfB family radical SAM enzyme
MYADILRKVKRECILHDVMLELTYACNLDCFFCYNDKKAEGERLGLAHYEQLLDDLVGMQTLNVTLTGGEPLLHPNFFEIGRAANERGFVVRVKTGGHGLGGRVAQRLKQEVNPFAVEISLHGATAETHERQTRVPGSFDYLVRNVPELKAIGLRPLLVSALTLWNEHQVAEMYALADSMGVTLRFQGPVVPRDDGDQSPLNIQPTQEGWQRYQAIVRGRSETRRQDCEQDLVNLDSGSERTSQSDGANGETPYCGTGSDSVVIDPFGNVYPCLRIRRSAGNLHQQGIAAVWAGSTVLPEVRKIALKATSRVRKDGPMQSLGSPLFCPGLELQGCETSCGGCGASEPDGA